MRTAVIILNWNTRTYLERWLPGLCDSCSGKADVIVCDNASTDGSMEMLAESFPQVGTIRLEQNFGFTGGYNRALEALDSDRYEFYVLINSDIDVPGDWLDPLVGFMDTHPECGVCGPKILALGTGFARTDRFEYAGAAGGLLTRHGFPYCRGRILHFTAKDKGQYDIPAEVKWVSGACLLVRKSLWRELGGLDKRFFAHMEEIDFCWRARLRGRKVFCVPQSAVWHLGGGTLPQGSPLKLKLNFRNSLLMLSNCLPDQIGPVAAARRIRTRMAIDRLIAAIYYFSGQKLKFAAIKEAHREFKELTVK